MTMLFDIHLHTRRYSPCSVIDPERLIRQAVKAGLDGLIITEHHYQWTQDEIAALSVQEQVPGFVVLAGFEYTSSQGDVLVYGLEPDCVGELKPNLPPGDIVAYAQSLGGVCIAAHPTRMGLGFDEQIFNIPFDAIEVRSVNLKEHEQRLAAQLATQLNLPAIAGSDAHNIHDIGRHATAFDAAIQSMDDFCNCMRRGAFGVAERWA